MIWRGGAAEARIRPSLPLGGTAILTAWGRWSPSAACILTAWGRPILTPWGKPARARRGAIRRCRVSLPPGGNPPSVAPPSGKDGMLRDSQAGVCPAPCPQTVRITRRRVADGGRGRCLFGGADLKDSPENPGFESVRDSKGFVIRKTAGVQRVAASHPYTPGAVRLPGGGGLPTPQGVRAHPQAVRMERVPGQNPFLTCFRCKD